MTLPVAILAGGLATRLGALTAETPKSLVDVNGQPFIVHQLELLREHGITRVVVLAGHLGERLRDTLGNGARLGVHLDYAFDGPRALGTGGAIVQALGLLGNRFLVLYGDSYLECDYGRVARQFVESGKRGLMTVCRNHGRWDRSNVIFRDGRITRYDKAHPDPDMRHIDYGLGAFQASAFDAVSRNGPCDLVGVYQALLARDDLAGVEVDGRFYEIGSPSGLEETRAHLAAKGLATR